MISLKQFPKIKNKVLEFGERLDLVLWETCHIYATCQAYRAEADFQHKGHTIG